MKITWETFECTFTYPIHLFIELEIQNINYSWSMNLCNSWLFINYDECLYSWMFIVLELFIITFIPAHIINILIYIPRDAEIIRNYQ